jgi:predicted PurR-regulated permease PerM
MIKNRYLALGLIAASVLVLWPFLPWIVLAVWLAVFARRVQLPLAHALGERPRIAAGITVLLLTMLLVPVAALLTQVVIEAIDLVKNLLSSERGHDVLEKLAGSERRTGDADAIDVVMGQGDRIWSVFRTIAAIATRAVIGLVILLFGVYAMLVDGRRWFAWAETHLPFEPRTLRRLGAAFIETGRGLFIGIGGAGLIQSVFATGAYFVLGVPQPLALGFLTLLVSVVPAIGTAAVWVPVAAGLAVTGRTTEAIGLAIFGIAVIGTVDNLVRPYLARRGHLQLPTYIVLVSMFGGVEVFGGWGLLLGPLIVRLASEAIAISSTPAADPSASR